MQPEGITIRRASEEDAFSIAQLSTAFGYPADAATIAARLEMLHDSKSDVVLVATDANGVAAGWLQAEMAMVLEIGFRAEIVGLVVSPEQRRRGIGRALVKEAEQWARSVGAEGVVVRSNVKRTESHAFYPALGYTTTKTQTVYWKKLAS